MIALRWAHGLVIDLRYLAGRGGWPMTWDASFTRDASGAWRVLFDFAGAGEIRLTCSTVELVPPS